MGAYSFRELLGGGLFEGRAYLKDRFLKQSVSRRQGFQILF